MKILGFCSVRAMHGSKDAALILFLFLESHPDKLNRSREMRSGWRCLLHLKQRSGSLLSSTRAQKCLPRQRWETSSEFRVTQEPDRDSILLWPILLLLKEKNNCKCWLVSNLNNLCWRSYWTTATKYQHIGKLSSSLGQYLPHFEGRHWRGNFILVRVEPAGQTC